MPAATVRNTQHDSRVAEFTSSRVVLQHPRLPSFDRGAGNSRQVQLPGWLRLRDREYALLIRPSLVAARR